MFVGQTNSNELDEDEKWERAGVPAMAANGVGPVPAAPSHHDAVIPHPHTHIQTLEEQFNLIYVSEEHLNCFIRWHSDPSARSRLQDLHPAVFGCHVCIHFSFLQLSAYWNYLKLNKSAVIIQTILCSWADPTFFLALAVGNLFLVFVRDHMRPVASRSREAEFRYSSQVYSLFIIYFYFLLLRPNCRVCT